MDRKLMTAVIAALACAAALALTKGSPRAQSASSSAQSGQFVDAYDIQGKATSGKAGKPLAGVTVVIKDGGTGEGTQFSSSCGTFTFYPLKPGEYRVAAYFGSTKIVCKPVRLPRMRSYRGAPESPEGQGISVVFPEDFMKKQTLEADCAAPD